MFIRPDKAFSIGAVDHETVYIYKIYNGDLNENVFQIYIVQVCISQTFSSLV